MGSDRGVDMANSGVDMAMRIILFILASLLTISLSFILISCRRQQNEEVLLRMAILTSGTRYGSYVYYFIIKSDRTFVSYYGINRHADISQRNFMREIQKRETAILSEQELQRVLELANIVAEGPFGINRNMLGGWDVMLWYDDDLYVIHGTTLPSVSGEIEDLMNKLIELSPLQGRNR